MALDLLTQELNSVFQTRRQKALQSYDDRVKAIYEAQPELKAADDRVHERGYEMALTGLSESPDEAEIEAAGEALQKALAEREALRHSLGFGPADFEVAYHCPSCEDYGYIDGEPCPLCYAKTRSVILREKYNQVMPKTSGLEAYSLDAFSDEPCRFVDGREYTARRIMASYYEEAKDFVRDFAKPGLFSLFFAGGAGTGKSTLAAAIGQSLLEEGYSVIYLSAFELAGLLEELRTMLKAFRPEPQRLSQLRGTMDILKSCDLLIVDDLGDERGAYRESRADFLQLINERYPAGKKMIWIANDSPDAIREAYTETVFSRLFGYGKTMLFLGEDQRIRQRVEASNA